MSGRTERNRKRQQVGIERNALLPDERDIGFNTEHSHGIRVSFPFTGRLSKNYLHRNRFGVFWNGETAAARRAITLKIKDMNHVFFKGKVWLKIFVQRPNLAGDSINVVDIVADAVKDAIGVDDRWFALENVDWQIVKDDPQIFIWVRQDINEAHELCSGCGCIKPLSSFLPSVQKRTAQGVKQGQKFCGECRELQA